MRVITPLLSGLNIYVENVFIPNMSKYQNRITKEIACIQAETDTFVKVYFEGENGIEGEDDENPRVINKARFLEKFEPVEPQKI